VKGTRHLASVDVIEVDETKEIFYCESIECVNYEEWCAFSRLLTYFFCFLFCVWLSIAIKWNGKKVNEIKGWIIGMFGFELDSGAQIWISLIVMTVLWFKP